VDLVHVQHANNEPENENIYIFLSLWAGDIS